MAMATLKDFTNLQQFVSLIGEEAKNETSAASSLKQATLQLPARESIFLLEVSRILKTYLGIEMSCSDINLAIINAFIRASSSHNNFVTLVGLSKHARVSIDEIASLRKLTEDEAKALKYLIALYKRDFEVRALVKNIQYEMDLNNHEVYTVAGENELVKDLLEKVEFEYLKVYRKATFNRGVRKLIIKCAVVGMVLGRS